jgi:cytosine/adenosine deaminase-related metal-dependent hydrolase
LGTLLKGATVVEFEPIVVERADLRVQDGKIVARGPELAPAEGDDVVDLTHKLLIPGLVSCHQRLMVTALRGLSDESSGTFLQRIEQEGQLELALDLDAVEVLGALASIEAIGAGTTTVFSSHSSPSCAQGSLIRLARGINEVGLRTVLSYEVSDRQGAVAREEAIEECVSFQRKAKGRFRGMIGAHASFTLSDDALEGLRSAVQETGAGLHIQVAEDPTDEKVSREQFGESPVARLIKHELLNKNAVVAHAVHLAWPELSQVISTGAWIVHNVRANLHRQVGYAPAGKFGSRAVLGCDRMAPDMFLEAQIANLRAREAGLEIDALKYIANGHHLASQVFGTPIGLLREGAAADLVILNCRPSIPLSAENVAKHTLSYWGSRFVEAVMIDGVWRLWAGRPLSVDVDMLAARGREVASVIAERLERAA